MTDLPTLTDGAVTLRPWREGDAEVAVAGHDELIAHWLGSPEAPTVEDQRRLVEEWRSAHDAGQTVAAFVIEHDAERDGRYAISLAAKPKAAASKPARATSKSGLLRRPDF